MSSRWLVGPLLLLTGCASGGGLPAPSDTASPAGIPASSPSDQPVSPPPTSAVTPERIRVWRLAVPPDPDSSFGDEVKLTVVDATGLVTAVAPLSPPVRPADPIRPAASNPEGDDRSLVVAWGLLECQISPTLIFERLDGGALVTLDPGGPWDCDAVGSDYAVVLALAGPVPAGTVQTRKVEPAEGEAPSAAVPTDAAP